MKNPFNFSAFKRGAEPAVAINQIQGGKTATHQSLGQVVPLLTKGELFLAGSAPGFARFVSGVEGLSWHVVEISSGLESPPKALLAVCVNSTAATVELVLDPSSSFVRQCFARWQRQGFADVLISKDGMTIACALRLPVRSLNAELATWPIQLDWPLDPVERMTEVVTCFENSASNDRDTVQLTVIEMTEDNDASRTLGLPARAFQAEPTPRPASKNAVPVIFRRRARHWNH